MRQSVDKDIMIVMETVIVKALQSVKQEWKSVMIMKIMMKMAL